MFTQCNCGQELDIAKNGWWDDKGSLSIKYVTCPVCCRNYVVKQYESWINLAYSTEDVWLRELEDII